MLQSILTNWKTSAAGALTVLSGVLGLLGVKGTGIPTDPSTALPAILAGIGLIVAHDGTTTTASPAPPAKS